MKKIIILVSVLTTACSSMNFSTSYYSTTNEKATFQGLMQDRYTCLQETVGTIESANASVSSTQGHASVSSRQLPDCSALMACLASKGWISHQIVNLDDPNLPFGFNVPNNLVINCSS